MADVLIVGAGLAGLQCARLLAKEGVQCLLVDRRRDVKEGIQTTGIFVRRTLEDFDLPESHLGPPIRRVAIYPPSLRAPLMLESPHDEFRIGDIGAICRRMLDEFLSAGGDYRAETTFVSAESDGDWSFVQLRSGSKTWSTRVRFIVGADGVTSTVARSLGLDLNTRWIVGVEDVFRRRSSGLPAMHCVIDPRIAPGYLAWLADDGEELHLGVGGYRSRFDPRSALRTFRHSVAHLLEGCGERVERRGGRIPVNGVLGRIGNRRGLIVGDAAGVVSPLTAGGLDGCYRLSRYAAMLLTAAVQRGDRRLLDAYSGSAFRSRVVSRRLMRRGFDLLTSPALSEVAVAAARLPMLQPLVRHVFFGRGSFPEADYSPSHIRSNA